MDTSRTIQAIGTQVEPQRASAGPAWLGEAMDALTDAGDYLAFDDDGALVVVALTREWTRIGRSLTADIRFDDQTVSRRHALVARSVDGVHVLDDRSLNGVWVNGERVDGQPLEHGDEIQVGRHVLCFLTLATDQPAPLPPGDPVVAGA